jgi:hypothetical protein
VAGLRCQAAVSPGVFRLLALTVTGCLCRCR